MKPRPKADDEKHRGCAKLRDKVAIITGGDSGIGRAVAIAFAKEAADVAVVYLEEEKDEGNEAFGRARSGGWADHLESVTRFSCWRFLLPVLPALHPRIANEQYGLTIKRQF